MESLGTGAERERLFLPFKGVKALFTFLPFYLFTFQRPFTFQKPS